MSIFSYGYVDAVSLDSKNTRIKFIATLACGVWYLFVLSIQFLGLFQLYRHYSHKPKPAVSPTLDIKDVPHITVLRPVKGLEPFLYDCLAASFRQCYPREKLTIYLCVASAKDPAISILESLLNDFPGFDAKILIEEDDHFPVTMRNSTKSKLGPNPKIRNLSRGYREAKGDIVWILDCNIWVGRGVMGRMVDKLYGISLDGSQQIPFKLVHQLPLVIDCSESGSINGTHPFPKVSDIRPKNFFSKIPGQSIYHRLATHLQVETFLGQFGGRLEEIFIGSSHAKSYTAINTISVAPCLVGKSNMFRKSHLDYLTRDMSNVDTGLDYFSKFICEDHIIGDALWRNPVQEEKFGQKFFKHGLMYGDLAIQPIIGVSVLGYINRRVRWIRARKWTVPVATFFEPGIESLLCSAYGVFGLTSLSYFQKIFNVPQTWSNILSMWILGISVYFWIDFLIFKKLHSGVSIEYDDHTPPFLRPQTVNQDNCRRSMGQWAAAWILRELLAFPIWIWASLCGTTVMWRGKKFQIRPDMSVIELPQQKSPNDTSNTKLSSKIQ